MRIVLPLAASAVGGIAATSVWAALTVGTKATQASSSGIQSFGAPAKGSKAASNPFAGLPKLTSGRPAPAFSIPGLAGGRVSLASFRGKPTVLNFFASWCPNCRAELGAFSTISKKYGSKVNFVGIDTNDSASKVKGLLASEKITYPIGLDPSATIASKYQVIGLPTTVFVSPTGTILGETFGAQTTTTLKSWMARIGAG